MDAFLISFGVVAAAELGDKTQLIALCFASQFRRPWPIILGILIATLLGNVAAVLVGQWVGVLLSQKILHVALGISFLVAAVWAFIPEKSEEEITCPVSHHGIFFATFITFFLAELGDKTQIATAALAAQFQAFLTVTLGTTAGMMLVNIPTVLLSHTIAGKIPLRKMKVISGFAFAATGFYELVALI